MKEKDIKVTFAPGCFDDFEGTQEELDEFIAEITKMLQDPEKMKAESIPIDLDNLNEEDEELIKAFLEKESTDKKYLQ